MINEIQCRVCGLIKSIDYYHRDSSANGSHGFMRICKECKKEYGVQRRKKLTEDQKEVARARNRDAYYRAKVRDPDLNKKSWQRKKARLIKDGKYDAYMATMKTPRAVSYSRYRSKYLQPDRKKREYLIDMLGGKCTQCGYCENIHALVLDHREGDGYLDRKRVGNKVSRYYVNHLDEARERLQVLCSNCNAIKAIENQEHNRTRRVSGIEKAA